MNLLAWNFWYVELGMKYVWNQSKVSHLIKNMHQWSFDMVKLCETIRQWRSYFKNTTYFHQHNPNWLEEWINLNLNCSIFSLLFKQFNNPLQGQWNPHSHVNFLCFCAFDQCKAFMLEAYDCYLTQKDPIG